MPRAPFSPCFGHRNELVCLLTSFGSFWAVEGAGARWPGGELALPALLAFLAVLSFALKRLLRSQRLALRPLEADA